MVRPSRSPGVITPTWTTTPPTNPGSYWWRYVDGIAPEVVRVHESNEGLLVIRGGYYGVKYLSQMARWFPRSEWSGPIQPPE